MICLVAGISAQEEVCRVGVCKRESIQLLRGSWCSACRRSSSAEQIPRMHSPKLQRTPNPGLDARVM